jgi:voltage-gated potassium channel
MDAALTKFEGKMETLGKYMRYRNIPNALQNRILSFYHYQWKLLKGADEEQLLRELPQSLQQQVANFMCRDLIASLPVLRKANIALLNALADSAEINIFSPNDDILKPGEPMKGTILISRGDVEVLHQGRIERKMKRFDSFGEESLFSKIVCDKNVRGKTFCEIFLLPREDFQEIIHAQCDHSHIIQMKETALTITKNATKANKLFGTAEDGIPTHGFRKYCHPDSRFRRIWNFVTLIGYLFYIFSLPLHVMKFLGGNSFRDDLILFIAGYMFDAFFAVNFYLQRNCFMYLEEGLIVFQQDQIVQNFDCAHNIKKEVLALSPFDALSIVDELRSCCHLFRLIKIFRVLDVVKCFDVLDKIGGNHIAFRVIKLNFSLLIVCHWVGCLWHGCASLGDTLGFPSNWRQVDEEDLSLSIDHSDMMGFAAYLRSVYWAIVGMSTVGYGDIVPTNVLETTYTTVIILFGGLVLPAIVGGLAAYLGSLNLDVVSHEKKLLLAKTYMRNSDVDKDLVDKVMNFYDYLWSRQGTIDEETIMNELPGSLRQRVAMFVNSIHIEAVPFLSLSDDSTKELLLSLLKPRVFMPNDFAVHKGELGTNMYFITKGSMVVLSEDQKILFSFLQSGDHFGESALLHTVATEYSVKAITYCDCFILNKDDFLEVTNGYLPQNEQKKLIMAISTTMYENMERNKNISTNINTRRKCQRLLLASGSLFSEESISGQSFSHSSGTLVPFRPESKFRACWNFVIVCICTYNAWVVPFRLAFKTNIILYYVDWALDCFLIIDMLLNYSQFAFVNEGELVNDTRRVRRQYMKRYFRLDFITTFPYDAIAFVATTSRQEISMAILRIPKLLKIRKVPLILGDIYHVLQDARVNLAPLRLIEFLSGVILVAVS